MIDPGHSINSSTRLLQHAAPWECPCISATRRLGDSATRRVRCIRCARHQPCNCGFRLRPGARLPSCNNALLPDHAAGSSDRRLSTVLERACPGFGRDGGHWRGDGDGFSTPMCFVGDPHFVIVTTVTNLSPFTLSSNSSDRVLFRLGFADGTRNHFRV